jgi:hypothetical protein
MCDISDDLELRSLVDDVIGKVHTSNDEGYYQKAILHLFAELMS